MSNSQKIDFDLDKYTLENQNLDLSLIAKIIFKNKKIIFIITLFSLFASVYFSFTKEKIYKGSFQIVLRDQKTNLNSTMLEGLSSNNNLVRLLNNQRNVDTNTQVEILKSPFVLMPVFEFVRSKKSQESSIEQSNISYKKWLLDSLDIQLEKGTKILNIEYFDPDKEFILTTLEKISEEYQTYSDRDRSTGLNNGIEYLNEQIKIFNKKSSNSIKEFQEFALDNNIQVPLSLRNKKTLDTNDLGFNSELFLKSRIDFLKKYIDIFSDEKQNFSDSYELSQTILTNLSEINEIKKDSQEVELIDNEIQKLNELENIFTNNDRSIKEQKSKIIFLKEKYISSFLNKLKALKRKYEIDLINNKKPREVYLELKKLASKSIREDLTLQNLESQLQFLLLEKAKVEKPWDLITEPTLFDKPIGSSKKRDAFVGIIFGLFISLVYVYLLERYKNLVYSPDELIKDFDFDFVLNLIDQDTNSSRESIELMLDNLKKLDIKGELGIFKFGKIPQELIDELSESLEYKSNDIKISFFNEFSQGAGFKNKLILFMPGIIKYKDLKILKQKINLSQEKFFGALLLNNRLDLRLFK